MILNERATQGFYQWDREQRLKLGEVPAGEVHFVHDAMRCNALAVAPYSEDGMMWADIPDCLLQKAGAISVFLYVTDNSAYSIYLGAVTVLPRPRPENYVYTEEERLTWQALDARITALEQTDTEEGTPTPSDCTDAIRLLAANGVYAADDADALSVTPGEYDAETFYSWYNIGGGSLLVDGKVISVDAAQASFYKAETTSYKEAYGYRYNRLTGELTPKKWYKYTAYGDHSDGCPLKLYSDGAFFPVRDETYYEVVLALIEVPAGTREITADMITDLRGCDRFCGFAKAKLGCGDRCTGLTDAQIAALDGMFQAAAYAEDSDTAYAAFREAFGIADGTSSDA